jgi:hypothetical protein
MKLKGILTVGLPALVIVLLNLLFGSVISWFLSIALIACMLFYFGQISIEQVIYRRLNQQQVTEATRTAAAALIRKYKVLLSSTLLTIVFIAGAVCIYRAANPGGRQPWFVNNDYYGISNTGIAFQQSLHLSRAAEDPAQTEGALQLQLAGPDKIRFHFRNFFEPAFIAVGEEGRFTPFNNIFPATFTDEFALDNGVSRLSVKIISKEAPWWSFFSSGEDALQYKIQLYTNDAGLGNELNIPLPFSDEVIVEDVALKEGKMLYSLLLNSRSFESKRPESYAVLNYILQALGNTYLLVNYDAAGAKSYSVFPAKQLIDNRFQLYVNGTLVAAQLENSTVRPLNELFYTGFHNLQEKAKVCKIDHDSFALGGKQNNLALLFDHPPAYLLTAPEEDQAIGARNVRFITNSNDRLVGADYQEAFFFQTYGWKTRGSIAGTMDYVSQRPNVPLLAGISDGNAARLHQTVNNNLFALESSEEGIHYLFRLRDYSDNGFRYSKLIAFAGIIYLSFLFLLVYFPGRNLVRIEPVILVVVYALLILRLLLYWRLATFPPLEQISKYELEHTILNFDYYLGWKLPLPLTVLWAMLFVAVLAIYRSQTRKQGAGRFSPETYWQLHTPARINKAYAIFMLGLLAVHIVNARLLHIDFLTRILTIVLPITGYCYFSMLANKHFYFDKEWVGAGEGLWRTRFKAFVHYLVYNPVFLISIMTTGFFALTDRGFAILFVLFLLLKNIFFNFLKKSFDSRSTSLKRMLLQPSNYWVYGLLAMVVYLLVLSFKSLFYYLLTYKLIVVALCLLLPGIVIWWLYPQFKKVGRVLLTAAVVFILLLLLPFTRQMIDSKITSVIKHVQYRASIIHQPISELLAQNPYASFQSRKIIETAENQWFINSYVSKPYDNKEVFNLRPYTKVGVDYNTQTRDVVLARFVISELGDFTMYLILLLTLLPLVLYLISYRVTDDSTYKLNFRSYAGAVPLLIFFTLSLFVWLTATNRFVFFGQDFPFLSLTSKLSVLLPLLLFGITLTQQPETYRSYQLNLKLNFTRYVFFTLLVAGFALTTIRSNELRSENFSVVTEQTRQRIDKDLNSILMDLQDSLHTVGRRFTYSGLMKNLAADQRFIALTEDTLTDNYTRSIFRQLVHQPSSALRVNNPLYIIFDGNRYTAMYNEHLYLQLPPVESRRVWNGEVREHLNLSLPQVRLGYDKTSMLVRLPYFRDDQVNNVQLAILPSDWFINEKQHIGLLNIRNSMKDKAEVFVYKSAAHHLYQDATAFAGTLRDDDMAILSTGQRKIQISFNTAGNIFAGSKWVNGRYRLYYPLKDQNFWMYHFANALKAAYSGDSLLNQRVDISLDYELGKTVQQMVNLSYRASQKDNRRFRFSVISADGDGNIRMMNDYVTNRMPLDPNNAGAIARLQQRHFFFSNIRNERDQWGNSNLLSLHLGPGSSVKPLIAAALASQINAGWEHLQLMAPVQEEYTSYGGFRLKRPWVNDDHYRAQITLPRYIEVSSNFYHSALMFLGSYPRSAFERNNQYQLTSILRGSSGANNAYPLFAINGRRYYLPNYDGKKGAWPVTDEASAMHKRSFFGNENSVLADGLEINAGLRTKDKDKQDYTPLSYFRVNMVDSSTFNLLSERKSSFYLWSFPEQSSLLQSQRAFQDPQQNFNMGLKTATLGGYPYQVSPYKMLEMYTSLFTQNRMLGLHVMRAVSPFVPWHTDATWPAGAYQQFLAANIFRGMHDVIYGAWGTATALRTVAGQNPGYYFYAKTGTINEQGSGARNSRRLVVAITNRDMQQVANIGNPSTKVYTFFFAVDNNRDFDWSLVNSIIATTMKSSSFTNYFN